MQFKKIETRAHGCVSMAHIHKHDGYGFFAISGIKKHAHNFGNPSIIHLL
jgi:hypothetical protein